MTHVPTDAMLAAGLECFRKQFGGNDDLIDVVGAEDLKAVFRAMSAVTPAYMTTHVPDEWKEVFGSLLDELEGALDQYNGKGPDYTLKDGTELIHVSTLLDRTELIERARALLESTASGEGDARECPDCCGTGVYVQVEPRCCGNLTKGGECRADCAIPEEIQESCEGCGGSGQAHGITTQSPSLAEEVGRLESEIRTLQAHLKVLFSSNGIVTKSDAAEYARECFNSSIRRVSALSTSPPPTQERKAAWVGLIKAARGILAPDGMGVFGTADRINALREAISRAEAIK